MRKISFPRTIELVNGKVRLINQLKLPHKLEYIETQSYGRIIKAIKKMEVRGAPAIGIAGAFALVLAAKQFQKGDLNETKEKLNQVAKEIMNTRPTAKNLHWAVERILGIIRRSEDEKSLVMEVEREAKKIALEDEESNMKIGFHGEKLIKDGDVILTICNAGSLATSRYGTALAPLYRAWEKGKEFEVVALETRPYLQGSRLTAFELKEAGIPVKIATDNSMGVLMEKEMINKVFVGADRITRNGYIANKIGTYPLALLAREHKVPFYVCAPTSTFDLGSTH